MQNSVPCDQTAKKIRYTFHQLGEINGCLGMAIHHFQKLFKLNNLNVEKGNDECPERYNPRDQ